MISRESRAPNQICLLANRVHVDSMEVIPVFIVPVHYVRLRLQKEIYQLVRRRCGNYRRNTFDNRIASVSRHSRNLLL